MHRSFDRTLTPHLPGGPAHDVAPVQKGGYRARLAASAEDLDAVLRLRGARFRGGREDADALDEVCRQVIVEPACGGAPVATFRFLHLANGGGIGLTYAARFYDLSRLQAYRRPVLEIGRFCTGGTEPDGDIVRIGWALLTRYVDGHGIGMMFGCSSFPGCDVARYRDALALLSLRHVAPADRAPGRRATEVVDFARELAGVRPVLREANRQMPPLLRTYLAMGGWVSDHAVIDRDLGTFHVFTGVEIDAIPETRKRLLRADAA